MSVLRLFIISIFLLLPSLLSAAPILHSSSTRDTLAIPFAALDSIGKAVPLSNGDSVYISVWSPGGSIVFRDSMAYNNANIKSQGWANTSIATHYTYVRRVDDLDGSSVSNGAYTWQLTVRDNTGANLTTTYNGMFQRLQSPLERVVDSLHALLDSLQDGANGIDVNLAAVSGDIAAADSLERMLDGGRATLFLNQLNIIAPDGNKSAIVATAHGNGSGIEANGGTTGVGFKVAGGSTSGNAADFSSTSGYGLRAKGGGASHGIFADGGASNGFGFWARGQGSGHGAVFESITTGDGLRAIGGATSGFGANYFGQGTGANTAYGFKVQGGASSDASFIRGGTTQGHALSVYASTGNGLHAVGGHAGNNTHGGNGIYAESIDSGSALYLLGGNNGSATSNPSALFAHARVGDGMYITAGTQSNRHGIELRGGQAYGGDALRIVATANPASGVSITAVDGDGIHAAAGTNGDGMELVKAGTGQDLKATIQGSDSTSIARWVWNTPKQNHNVAATFGDYLDADISGISGGSGAYSITIVAFDSAVDQVVGNVDVAVRNLNQSALVASRPSDQLGKANFNLNASSYVIVARAPGYFFTPFDTMLFAGPATDTVFGYRFNPGSPTSPSFCRVYGWLKSVNGQPEIGATVSASLPKGVTQSGNIVVSPFAVSTVTGNDGYFFLDLMWSSTLEPSTTQYEVSITRPDGAILRKRLTIPNLTTWLLDW